MRTNFFQFINFGVILISSKKPFITSTLLGRGGGQVVSVLAFYSDNPSSNPAEVYNFSVKLLLKRTKINKKLAGVGQREDQARLFST